MSAVGAVGGWLQAGATGTSVVEEKGRRPGTD
jgi:hypothetical protein